MPIHDWTRVRAGIFHAFHQRWITHLEEALNDGVLPPDYYAINDQVAGKGDPDILALHAGPVGNGNSGIPEPTRGPVAVSVHPPQTQFMYELEASLYTPKASVLTIRHASSDDRVVAVVEIVSPGNKGSNNALRQFVEKIAAYLHQGVHVLVVDLHPPTPRDPQGLHAVIWAELGGQPHTLPPECPLTLAGYSAMPRLTAFVEHAAVGDTLKAMPLFLTTEEYVHVPLEETYMEAFTRMARRWRAVLEAPRP